MTGVQTCALPIVIDLIAKHLPADTRLVVKEHITGFAGRPRGFHSWIKNIPNVVFASQHLSSIPIIAQCQAAVVLTSTVGIEAAAMGIPVLSFGRHNAYNFLPHVYCVDSLKELPALIQRVCQTPSAQELERRQQDGARYLAALKACSVDFGQENLFRPETVVSEGTIDRFVSLLCRTLQPIESAYA